MWLFLARPTMVVVPILIEIYRRLTTSKINQAINHSLTKSVWYLSDRPHHINLHTYQTQCNYYSSEYSLIYIQRVIRKKFVLFFISYNNTGE